MHKSHNARSSDAAGADTFADSDNTIGNFFNNPTPPASPGQFQPSNPYSPAAHRARRTSTLVTHPEEERRLPISPESDTAAASAAHHSGSLPIRSGTIRPASGPRSRNPEQHARSRSDGHFKPTANRAAGHNRNNSVNSVNSGLNQRYPGDMTHRPLDMLTHDTRVADRRHRKRFSEADIIDRLDTIGPIYHHGGPYDATLASRNMNKMYSPVEAVRDSNMAALRATPREFIMDSLIHHYPLQGTSTIPSGGVDGSGNVMTYQEGADLMREPDAAGGAYKRYDFLVGSFSVSKRVEPSVPCQLTHHLQEYHPDDLKGKGEPSFTIERDIKAGKGKGKAAENGFEMESNPLLAKSLRRKSVPIAFSSGSNVATTANNSNSSSSKTNTTTEVNSVVRRQNSTGHRISEGLKRRLGSLRRKKSPSPEM